MRARIAVIGLITCWIFSVPGSGECHAGKRPAAPVPPTLEIEILDPGVDPHGNPAVVVNRDPDSGQVVVDIPPVILVHRYYYSGDRSFQAQMLPGGPSIVVANHPRTGVRCYVPLQMMPGAPRVTYTAHGIEYDYGDHGITVAFGILGHPTVKYRSGKPWTRRIGNLVHAEQLQEHGTKAVEQGKQFTERSALVASGVAVEAGRAVETATLPVRNLFEMMPFGKILFASDLPHEFAQKAHEHQRQHAVDKAQRDQRWEEATIRTIR